MAEKNLLKRIYDSLGPEVKVDKDEKTFEIIRHGYLFENLTGAYYILKGYREIKS